MKTQALAQIPETKHAGGPVVRLSDVVKVYKEGDVEVSAIKGITFDIPRQRFSMIVGPSGSGKTTLLNLIGCIDKPTQGTIFVGGQDVGALNDNAISDFRAQRVGFIFQNFQLDPRALRLGEHRAPIDAAGRACSGAPRAEHANVGSGRAIRPTEAAPEPAQRWPEAARHHSTRSRKRAGFCFSLMSPPPIWIHKREPPSSTSCGVCRRNTRPPSYSQLTIHT